jgi:hypothetical protein
MEYFKNPGMTKDQFKKVYESAKDEGSRLFSKERFEAFRKKEPNPKAPEAAKSTDGKTEMKMPNKGKGGRATIKRKPAL